MRHVNGFFLSFMLLLVSFVGIAANAMDTSQDKTEEEKPITTMMTRRDVRQIPLQERGALTQTFTFRGVQLRGIKKEDIQRVAEFLQDHSLTPQRLVRGVNAFAKRYGLSQRIVNEVIIDPLLDHVIYPRLSFPLSVQTHRRAIHSVQPAESFPVIEAPQPRQLTIGCSLFPFFPFEITVPEPRFSRRLTNMGEEERKETPSPTVRVQQRAFDWTYTISEYIENHPYVTMLWLVVLSFLFNVSRH